MIKTRIPKNKLYYKIIIVHHINMRVFLTGATGAIGGAALLGLVQGGHHVVCAVRNISKAQVLVEQYGDKITLVEINESLDLYSRFREISRGFNKICFSGFAFSANDKDSEITILNALLDSAKESAQSGPTTFVFTTGCLIAGEQDHLIGESEQLSSNSVEMIKWRIETEDIALNANSENLHSIVVRPGFLWGGSFVDLWFKACKKYGKIVVPEKNGRVCHIHKEDLGALYRIVLENHATGIFTGSEGVGPTTDEIVEIAKNLTGVQVVEKVENIWSSINEYGFYLFGLSLHQMLDSQRARELYGYQPKYSIRNNSNLIILD